MEMRGNEESFERGQTIKHIRWKGGESIILKIDGKRSERKLKMM